MNEYEKLLTELKNKYDFLKKYNYLENLPTGWVLCFGKLFCEDLAVAIDVDGIKDYEVFQSKEKFGELRWYDNGGETVQKVIDDYAYLSKHTCILCGQLFVPIIDDGWISPCCMDCYRELRGISSTEDVDWDKIIVKETKDEIFDTKYTIHKYLPSGDKEIIDRDIKYIIDRVDDRYKKDRKGKQ